MLPEITHVIASLIANPPGGAKCLSVKEAVGLALATRPLRYGLSTEYAIRRYRAIKSRHIAVAQSETGDMWKELVEKTDTRRAEHPDEDDFAALDYVLSYDSPSRYFLTPVYAEKLFYRRHSLKPKAVIPPLPQASKHRKRISHSKPI